MLVFLKAYTKFKLGLKEPLDEFCHWTDHCNCLVALSLFGVFTTFSQDYYSSQYLVLWYSCINQWEIYQLTQEFYSLFSKKCKWIRAVILGPSGLLFLRNFIASSAISTEVILLLKLIVWFYVYYLLLFLFWSCWCVWSELLVELLQIFCVTDGFLVKDVRSVPRSFVICIRYILNRGPEFIGFLCSD